MAATALGHPKRLNAGRTLKTRIRASPGAGASINPQMHPWVDRAGRARPPGGGASVTMQMKPEPTASAVACALPPLPRLPAGPRHAGRRGCEAAARVSGARPRRGGRLGAMTRS